MLRRDAVAYMLVVFSVPFCQGISGGVSANKSVA